MQRLYGRVSILFKCFTFIILVILDGCNLDMDNSDLQVSPDIRRSQLNGLYINSYVILDSAKSPVNFQQCWLERSWRNQPRLFRTEVKVINGSQIVMTLPKKDNKFYSDKDYPFNWNMETDSFGSLARYNSTYAIFLKDLMAPEEIKVRILRRYLNNWTIVDSFVLKKQL